MPPRDALTAERLREVLDYDPDTGIFTWKMRIGSAVAGKEAGCVVRYSDRLSYKQLQVDGRLDTAHRLAWLYVYGEWPSELIDHKDGDGLNNRIDNLRLANKAQNSINRGPQANNTSGYKGVTWYARRKKWMVRLKVSGRPIFLGYFDDKEDAAKAYRAAAEKHFGEYCHRSQH